MYLNIQDIRDYTGADDAFIVKLFNKFLEHIHNDISKLKSETEARNWNGVKSVSHQVLSSARIFSLKEMVVLHENIEKDCINNTTDKVPEMVTELVKLYEEVIPEMNALKNEISG